MMSANVTPAHNDSSEIVANGKTDCKDKRKKDSINVLLDIKFNELKEEDERKRILEEEFYPSDELLSIFSGLVYHDKELKQGGIKGALKKLHVKLFGTLLSESKKLQSDLKKLQSELEKHQSRQKLFGFNAEFEMLQGLEEILTKLADSLPKLISQMEQDAEEGGRQQTVEPCTDQSSSTRSTDQLSSTTSTDQSPSNQLQPMLDDLQENLDGLQKKVKELQSKLKSLPEEINLESKLYLLPRGDYIDGFSVISNEWELAAWAENEGDGYFGAAFYNRNKNQLVFSHRGTVLERPSWNWFTLKRPNWKGWQTVITSLEGCVRNKITSQVYSACKFSITILKKIDRSKIHVAFTGHSLGGWLAQISTFSCDCLKLKNVDENNEKPLYFFHLFDDDVEAGGGGDPKSKIRCVAFDSPGCFEMLTLLTDLYYPGKYSEDSFDLIKICDITIYVNTPNIANCCRLHRGVNRLLQVYRSFEGEDFIDTIPKGMTFRNNIPTHYITNFILLLNDKENVTTLHIKDWPSFSLPEKKTEELRQKDMVFFDNFVKRLIPEMMQIIYSSVKSGNELRIFLKEVAERSKNKTEENGVNIFYLYEPYNEDIYSALVLAENEFDFLRIWRMFIELNIIPEKMQNILEAKKLEDFGLFLKGFELSKNNTGRDILQLQEGHLQGEKKISQIVNRVKHLLSIYPEAYVNILSDKDCTNESFLKLKSDTFFKSLGLPKIEIQFTDIGITNFEISGIFFIITKQDVKNEIWRVEKIIEKNFDVQKTRCYFLGWQELKDLNKKLIMENIFNTPQNTETFLVIECKEDTRQQVGEFAEKLKALSSRIKLIFILHENDKTWVKETFFLTDDFENGIVTEGFKWSDIKTEFHNGLCKKFSENVLNNKKDLKAMSWPYRLTFSNDANISNKKSILSVKKKYGLSEPIKIGHQIAESILYVDDEKLRESRLSNDRPDIALEEEFYNICQKSIEIISNNKFTIYWFSEKSSKHRIFASDFYIDRNFIISGSPISKTKEDLLSYLAEKEYKTVIFSGEAGMGKSTTLLKIAKEMANGSWVIWSDLKDFKNEDEAPSEANNRSVFDFLLKIDEKLFSNPLAESLLSSCIFNNDKVPIVLFFDNFDRILNVHTRSYLLNIFNHLQETSIRVWIGTRTCSEEILMEKVSGIHVKMTKINGSHQVELIKKVWFTKLFLKRRKHFLKVNKRALDKFAKNLFQHVFLDRGKILLYNFMKPDFKNNSFLKNEMISKKKPGKNFKNSFYVALRKEKDINFWSFMEEYFKRLQDLGGFFNYDEMFIVYLNYLLEKKNGCNNFLCQEYSDAKKTGLVEKTYREIESETTGHYIGTPMQCRMIGEVLQPEYIASNIPEEILSNRYKLYTELMDFILQGLNKTKKEQILESYSRLAFQCRFPDEAKSFFEKKNLFDLENTDKKLNEVGIFDFKNKKFVHDSFSDFFTANQICSLLNFITTTAYSNLCLEDFMIINVLLKKECKILRKFLNDRLLVNDGNVLFKFFCKRLLEIDENECRSSDEEKTAIQVAIAENNDKLAEALLNSFNDTKDENAIRERIKNIIDNVDIYDQTALHLALLNNHTQLVETILQFEPKRNILYINNPDRIVTFSRCGLNVYCRNGKHIFDSDEIMTSIETCLEKNKMDHIKDYPKSLFPLFFFAATHGFWDFLKNCLDKKLINDQILKEEEKISGKSILNLAQIELRKQPDRDARQYKKIACCLDLVLQTKE